MLFYFPCLFSHLFPVSCSCSGVEQKDSGWGLPYDFSLSSWNNAKLLQLWKSDKRETKKRNTNSGDLKWQNKKNEFEVGWVFSLKKKTRAGKVKSINTQVERM